MARFYGNVGFVETKETAPGVFEEIETERPYYGDVLYENRRMEGTDNLNDNLRTSNRVSIVADAYANQHFSKLRYVEWMGARWKIATVEPAPPRLTLYLGEVYNG